MKASLKTQIKLLKEDLTRSEKLLREVQKVAHLGNWELDCETNIVTWSDEAYRILGLKPQKTESSLMAFLSFLHPEDLTRVTKIINSAMAASKNFSYCCRVSLKNGSIKHLYCQGVYEFNKNKKPLRLYGIIHDVTELKKMQNNICLSEILGQENERERFSKELHDGLGQLLVGINLQLKGVEVSSARLDKNLSKRISVINSAVQDTIQEVRAISHNMSPHMLRKYGLITSLQNICKSVSSVSLSFKTNLKTPLEKSTEIILYRIVHNIIKHSQATKGNIILLKKGKRLFLIVEDNGIGFENKLPAQTSGMGLNSIRNRIHLIGGNLRLSNDVLKGTRIEITIPN